VLTSLVNAEGKLDIGVMPDGMSINGEAIEDESGLVGDTATAWWKGGICGVLIQSLPSPEETEALLDALSSQDADAGETLVAQLDALESDAVRVATLEYDNLVPRAAMPGGALSDSTDLLRSLVDASAVTAPCMRRPCPGELDCLAQPDSIRMLTRHCSRSMATQWSSSTNRASPWPRRCSAWRRSPSVKA
jgi:hypothetical protein